MEFITLAYLVSFDVKHFIVKIDFCIFLPS